MGMDGLLTVHVCLAKLEARNVWIAALGRMFFESYIKTS